MDTGTTGCLPCHSAGPQVNFLHNIHFCPEILHLDTMVYDSLSCPESGIRAASRLRAPYSKCWELGESHISSLMEPGDVCLLILGHLGNRPQQLQGHVQRISCRQQHRICNKAALLWHDPPHKPVWDILWWYSTMLHSGAPRTPNLEIRDIQSVSL